MPSLQINFLNDGKTESGCFASAGLGKSLEILIGTQDLRDRYLLNWSRFLVAHGAQGRGYGITQAQCFELCHSKMFRTSN